MSKEINTVGARIRECRKEMGYSQETMAAMLYMKKTIICKYEKDIHDIPSSVWEDMSDEALKHYVERYDDISGFPMAHIGVDE